MKLLDALRKATSKQSPFKEIYSVEYEKKKYKKLETRWKPNPSCPKCHSTKHIKFFNEYGDDRRQICKKCGYIGEEIEFVMYPPY